MSPEIRRIEDGKIIADVPDTTGLYRTKDGGTLYVNVESITLDKSRYR